MTRGGSIWIALALVATLGAVTAAAANPQNTDAPPATLVSGDAARGAAVDPVLELLKLDRLSCKFTEEKRIALLARPLRSTGTIYFERDRGIARTTLTPKVQRVVLTKTSLRIRTDKRTEDIPLAKSKDLKAFAQIFPALLRGDRTELDRAFEIGLYGSDKGWWALSFTPKAASLKKLVRGVVVVGRKGGLVSLQITETSGDTTDTRLTDVLKNGNVPDTELAAAFGEP